MNPYRTAERQEKPKPRWYRIIHCLVYGHKFDEALSKKQIRGYNFLYREGCILTKEESARCAVCGKIKWIQVRRPER
jgi:hypothetical protein